MREIVNRVAEALADPERILPGGFLYMNDILGDTQLLAQIGEVFATRFADRSPGAVVTVETGGIPIAMATARALNVPLAIVRRSGRLGDGTVVTMNYVTGPGQQMETMALPRRAIRPGTRVLVVDDRSEEHTSELQSRENLVCRLLLEKKKNNKCTKRIET